LERGASAISSSTTLEWERFDYDTSPKWDARFEDGIHLASSHDEDWREVEKRETEEDTELQKKFEKLHSAWERLDMATIQRATEVLMPFINETRWERVDQILQQRTSNVKFMFENPSNPSNVWACLRTLDSFGIQDVDVVIQSGMFKGKAALSQKRGMRTAMGSAKWLTLKNHLTVQNALEASRDDYHIVCTDVNPTSKDIREVDWDASGKKICIVMGNEERGVSDEAKAMADEFIYLPMSGFAESFNLGAATAITCAHLSAASRDGKGPFRPGNLTERELKTLQLKGALNSIQKKTARALFRKEGIQFPPEIPL